MKVRILLATFKQYESINGEITQLNGWDVFQWLSQTFFFKKPFYTYSQTILSHVKMHSYEWIYSGSVIKTETLVLTILYLFN